MPDRLSIGADVVEAAARAQLASEESRVDAELAVPNEWEDLSEQDRAECLVDMEAAIVAADKARGLHEEARHGHQERVTHTRLATDWRPVDGEPAYETGQSENSPEYRYECANGHTWVMTPVARMNCPACLLGRIQRLKPVDHYDELARQLWIWNTEHGPSAESLAGFPYERLIDLTKDDLRALARRLAPFVTVHLDHPANRDLLVHLIAAELDKPSVYMGGPSQRSKRKAEAIMRIVERPSATSEGEPG